LKLVQQEIYLCVM